MAARKYFNDLELKKLPAVKSLQAEYAQLLNEKKAAYGEYRQVKRDKQELLTVKMNVDNLLELGSRREKKMQREDATER